MEQTNCGERIGVVAGWGSFPVEVAQQLRAAGKEVVVVALKDHANEQLNEIGHHVRWFGVLKVGAHLRYLANQGVQKVAFAGKLFKHKILYQGRGWIDHAPDFTCCRLLYRNFITHSRDGRDDTVLTAIVNEYDRRGMRVLTINEVAPSLLVSEGCLTRQGPTRNQQRDIEFGWNIAKQMGELDIGQSMTIKDQIVLGVEAIEGTDALIARSGELCSRGGFTLVKVAKPKQDMRFDVPTVGKRTIEKLAAAGGKVLAIEAHRTILVDREETIQRANQLGVVIISQSQIQSTQVPEHSPATLTTESQASDSLRSKSRRVA